MFTLNPALLVVDLSAPLWQVVKVLRGSSEVLHAMRVVAVGPVVLLIEDWAEGSFVAVQQELMQGEVPLELV